jgi:FMN-dependent NADH-azoreductase
VAHLLHVDSSIRGDASVSRKLSARAAAVWHAAHPGGTVTYRDLGRDPLPHLDAAGGLARGRATGRVAALVPFPDRPHVASPPRSRIRMP